MLRTWFTHLGPKVAMGLVKVYGVAGQDVFVSSHKNPRSRSLERERDHVLLNGKYFLPAGIQGNERVSLLAWVEL